VLDRLLNTSPSPEFSERRAALALIEAMLPSHAGVPGGGEATLRRTEALLREFSPAAVGAWRKAQQALGEAAALQTGRAFYALDADAQDALLQRWSVDPVTRAPLSLLALVYKLVHFDQSDVYARMGGRLNVVRPEERPRWMQQVVRGADCADGARVECDVVVVGTGAGGAVVGRELTQRGYAVAFVEEGELHRRDSFNGSAVDAHLRFYRGALAVGNAPMPVFMGRLVGGSTAVNTGTCFRTPPWVLDRWCDELGSDEFAPSAMAPWFDRVEGILQVAPMNPRFLGPFAARVEAACGRLGWRYARARRNAPGCEGQGFCDFGCRTDARRSTNISYIPPALERGAMLYTGLRADRVCVEAERATGLDAVTAHGARVRFRARAVILAGGALPTPSLLLRQGLANRSGQVGRNLSLHPSGSMSAEFPEAVRVADYVPQGFFVDQFARDGFLLLGAGADRNILAPMIPAVGRRLMDVLSRGEHIGGIATLAADASADGVVRAERDGRIVASYSLKPLDVQRLHQAMVRAGEMLVAAGATRLFPLRTSRPILAVDDLPAFARALPDASDLPLVSYHPLGTCKMGRDPRTSVVDLDHQTHDVRRLFVVDGSTVSGPLGVNPQLTIMACATRAAARIADVLG